MTCWFHQQNHFNFHHITVQNVIQLEDAFLSLCGGQSDTIIWIPLCAIVSILINIDDMAKNKNEC